MAEPMLALFSGDGDSALTVIESYTTMADPWMRAAGWLYRSTHCLALGRLDDTESDCRTALAQFRVLGDAWGIAVSLMQSAELAQVRGDYATAVAALEESAEIGLELQAWGDMGYIIGMLAAARARAGDVDRAREDMRRAERAIADVASTGTDEWILFTSAEIAWRAGDLAEADRYCAASLAEIEGKRIVWFQGMRAQAEAMQAVVALAAGDAGRCREHLGAALAAARDWVELPPLATAIDACAAYALDVGGDAATAATLLGAAHSIRGAFNEASLTAPRVREAARRSLGEAGFGVAYQRGRELSKQAAVECADAQVRRR